MPPDSTADPLAAWPGFTPVFYTQIPDEFFDLWLPRLSGAECKVLCYLLRHTFGWKKTHDRVSFSQITGGIVRRDGTRQDGGAGVARSTAEAAIAGLVAHGLIAVERTARPDGGYGPNRYYVRVADQPTPYTAPRHNPIPEIGMGLSRPPVTQEITGQETIQQEDRLTDVEKITATRAGLSDAEYVAMYRRPK